MTNIKDKLKEWYALQSELYNLMTLKELSEHYVIWFEEEPKRNPKKRLIKELMNKEYQWKKVFPYHQLKQLVLDIEKEIKNRKPKKDE